MVVRSYPELASSIFYFGDAGTVVPHVPQLDQ